MVVEEEVSLTNHFIDYKNALKSMSSPFEQLLGYHSTYVDDKLMFLICILFLGVLTGNLYNWIQKQAL